MYWVNYHGGGRQLASSGKKPLEIKEEVGATDKGAGKRGYGCSDLGTYILGGGSVSNAVRV